METCGTALTFASPAREEVPAKRLAVRFAAGALGGSASEYTPITGTARAVTVPSGNSGTLETVMW